MSPITHAFLGWALAEAAGVASRRDRALITLAGVIPDVDGLGAVVELATRNGPHPLLWFSRYHHLVAHNLLAAVLMSLAAGLLARRRLSTALLAAASFHLHLLGDLVGARGPDGSQWPLHYFWPFLHDRGLTWAHQWELNAWPNFAITLALMAWMLARGRHTGRTMLECLSPRADGVLIRALRRRWPLPGGDGSGGGGRMEP